MADNENKDYSVQDLQDNLDYLNETKRQIKNAIINKGQTIGANDTFRSYADKIEAIQTGEDLDTELDEQDDLIEDIKEALNGKSGSNLNIFAQTTEPDIKKGIWLQTSNEIENIIQDEDVFGSEQWNTSKMSSLTYMPKSSNPMCAAAVGNYIYYFGYDSSKYAYKYNISTNTHTVITTTPVNLSGKCVACAVGTDIHIFGGSDDYPKTHYVYDTLTDAYTSKASLPSLTKAYATNAITKGTDIYVVIFGNNSTLYLYKYDTLTNTYNQIKSFSSTTYCFTALLDDNFYMFSGVRNSSYSTTATKYNISTDITSSITNTPEIMSSSMLTHGKTVTNGINIYLFGGEGGANGKATKNYKYNTLTDTYTTLPDATNSLLRSDFGMVLVDVSEGKEIYFLGGQNDSKKIQVFSLVSKTYDKDNSIILAQNAGYKYTTELVDSEVINGLIYEFDDVYYYTIQGGLDNSIPTYYGNGTSWVKFKN